MNEIEEMLTARQVARVAKVKVATVQAWAREGKFPGRKVGRQYLFAKNVVLRFLGR